MINITQNFNDKFNRSKKWREPNKVYLIFCEWKSEKLYFKYLWNKYGKSVKCNLLQYKDFKWITEEIKKEISNSWLDDADEAFCVIDKDNHSEKEYSTNYKNIAKYSKLIFSSKSFEVWVLMHFSNFERQVQNIEEYRKLINEKNNRKFFMKKWINYEVWKPYSEKIWDCLLEKTKDAISNAKIISKKQLKENKNNKFKCEPYTDIWDLVSELIK